MNSPAAVREFFGTVLQQVCHLKFDVIAGTHEGVRTVGRLHPGQAGKRLRNKAREP